MCSRKAKPENHSLLPISRQMFSTLRKAGLITWNHLLGRQMLSTLSVPCFFFLFSSFYCWYIIFLWSVWATCPASVLSHHLVPPAPCFQSSVRSWKVHGYTLQQLIPVLSPQESKIWHHSDLYSSQHHDNQSLWCRIKYTMGCIHALQLSISDLRLNWMTL